MDNKEYVHFADWMGSYTDLCSSKKNYVVCEWANGAYGSLKDYDELFLRRLIIPEEPEWDIIRFVEHRWNPKETGAGLLLKATLTEEEKKLCPIVAVGLVAYYIKQYSLENNRNINDIFEKYYDKCIKWYEYTHHATPNGWKSIVPNDFPIKHIKAELGNWEISKVLLPYLQDKDAKHIEEIASNYFGFVKETKITEVDIKEKEQPMKLSKELSSELKKLVDNINSHPELLDKLEKIVVKAKFDYSFMESIISGLTEEVFMDKAIIVIADAWNKCLDEGDDACYEIIGYHPTYHVDLSGFYEEKHPLKMLKYQDIVKTLEEMEAAELKRRRIKVKLDKRIKELNSVGKEKPQKPREKVDIKSSTHSFRLKLKDISESEKHQRIATFFGDLSRNGKYIMEDTDTQVFVDNFTGKHTAEKIVWTAEFKQLLYLITYLHKMGVLEWNTEKPKPGKRQMICIVFKIRELEYKEVDGKIEKEAVPAINDIDVERLNTQIDDSDEGLDPIIRRLLFGETSIDDGLTILVNEEGVSRYSPK